MKTFTVLFNVYVSGACVANVACPRKPDFTIRYCTVAYFTGEQQTLLCSKQKPCSSNPCKPIATVKPIKLAELEGVATMSEYLDCPLNLFYMEFLSLQYV